MLRRSTRGVFAAVALGGAVLAGCGGDSEPLNLPAPSSDSIDPGTTAARATTSVALTTAPSTSSVPSTPPPVEEPPWTPATGNLEGLSSECGNMSLVSARPDRNALIAGVALQGLWTLEGRSDTWTRLGEGAGSAEIINRTSSIVYDPDHPETFWESGIYNGGGAYRTSDDGATFEALGDVTHSDLVAVDLSDPERRTLLSGTHEQPILYRSADGGATWTDVSQGLPAEVGFAIAPLVIDAQTHLLGSRNGAEAGVFRTTDGGATWTRVHPRGVAGPPLVADGTIYWIQEGGGGLIASTDGGLTWTERAGPIGPLSAHLVELPDGRIAALGESTVVVSEDQGATWTSVGQPLPYQPTGIAYSPFRKSFYIWYFTCDSATDNPIPADAIMRFKFDYETR